MPRTFRAEDMTPGELREAVARRPIFILTTGILEWHGDHLPLGTDALKMRGIAERLADRAQAILLPQNWFGVVGFDEMTGTITFSKALVKQMLAEFFANLEKMGAKLIVFLTGHYGRFQVETITEAAAGYLAHSAVRIVAQPEYEGADFTGLDCGADHADKYETSLMMALHPELVQMEKFQPELQIPSEYPYRENAWGFHSPTGPWTFSGDLRKTASSQLGEKLIERILSHLEQRINDEYAKCPQ